MTNAVKQSLENNSADILKNLPEEFHSDFKASMADAAPIAQPSDSELRQIVVKELKDNPNVDDAVCIPAFEADKAFNQAIPQPDKDALGLEEQDLLSEKMKECGLQSLPN